MNANEISPKAGSRLHRIKIISRIARFIVFCFFVFTIWFLLKVVSGLFRQRDFNVLTNEILLIILQSVICVWYWKLAQLFRFYERGLIFAGETIRCIKSLGLLCAVGWMIKLLMHSLLQQHPLPLMQSISDIGKTLPPGVTLNEISVTRYQMGFFSFDFGTGIDFGLLFAGIVIVLIAWIMDEGRKIQEEQELTV
jgi:Protein of unknown function (DUF2975)